MSIGKSSLARAAVAAGSVAPAASAAHDTGPVGGCVQIDIDSIRPVKGERLPGTAEPALVQSVTEYGIAEPLLLAQTDSGLLLLSGGRRLCAARAAGLTAVPALVREMSATQAAQWRRRLHRFAAPAQQPVQERPAAAGITAVGDAMPDWLL